MNKNKKNNADPKGQEIIIDIYKNIVEYMAKDIIDTNKKNEIQSLESWAHKYLIPSVQAKCPERLTEIRKYVQYTMTITKEKLKNKNDY